MSDKPIQETIQIPEFVDISELQGPAYDRAQHILATLIYANEISQREAADIGVTTRHRMLETQQFAARSTRRFQTAIFRSGLITYYRDKKAGVPLAFWPHLPFAVPKFDREGNVYFIATDEEGSFASSLRYINHDVVASMQREVGKTGYVKYSYDQTGELQEEFVGSRVGHHDAGTPVLRSDLNRPTRTQISGSITIPDSHITRNAVEHTRAVRTKAGHIIDESTVINLGETSRIEMVDHGYIPVGKEAVVVVRNGRTEIINRLEEWQQDLTITTNQLSIFDPETEIYITYTDSYGRTIRIDLEFEIEGDFDPEKVRLIMFSPFADKRSIDSLVALLGDENLRLQELIRIYDYFGLEHTYGGLDFETELPPEIYAEVFRYLKNHPTLCVEPVTAEPGSESHEILHSCTVRKFMSVSIL